MFFESLKKLLGRQYQPLNRLEISRRILINNYKFVSSLNKNISIAPVLKSNAYGHGLIETAKVFDSLSPPFLCVDSIFEAYKLFNSGIKSKILIMGYVDPINLMFKELPFSYTVYKSDQLKKILKYQPKAGIHIFVDTGMHREGTQLTDLENLINLIPEEFYGNIDGVMSHFGEAESPGKKETMMQIENFKKALRLFKKKGINVKWTHIGNSSAIKNHKELGLAKYSNLVRCGLSLYENALSFITRIVQVKKIGKGEFIGYDFTYKTKNEIKMAVLPVGYNDGVDRILSNRGKVIIKGLKCPIIGRVSMNITTVDVTKVKNVKSGDEVKVIFNPKIRERIPYGFFVHLNPEIKRVLVD